MRHRIWRMGMQLWRKKGFDILLTHAPAYGVNDIDTPSHRGFESFLYLIDRYRPRYFIHGHVHMNYGHKVPRTFHYGDTTVINAYEYFELNFGEKQ